ncbi:TfoX/Sxy family protein [Polycladidibacter stylochi]|uniref:TfoX/Sxy family protein n=1 Tax=Polycladidibacter stylochi TaxID=1807766 RepID=UPI00082B661F|nr:TfoX/Sxy family protein [Pseudovibrio stylochi]
MKEMDLQKLLPEGAVELKGMFGGLGLYCQGVMFGLCADNKLFLRSETNAYKYLSYGQLPFFVRMGQQVLPISFYSVPQQVMEDTGKMRSWLIDALNEALRLKTLAQKKEQSLISD